MATGKMMSGKKRKEDEWAAWRTARVMREEMNGEQVRTKWSAREDNENWENEQKFKSPRKYVRRIEKRCRDVL